MQLVKCAFCGETYDLHAVSVIKHEIGEIIFITPCCQKEASDAKEDFEYIDNAQQSVHSDAGDSDE